MRGYRSPRLQPQLQRQARNSVHSTKMRDCNISSDHHSGSRASLREHCGASRSLVQSVITNAQHTHHPTAQYLLPTLLPRPALAYVSECPCPATLTTMADASTPAAESKAAPAPEHPKPGVGDEDPLVLVTGVSGYIGAHVAKALLERGYRCVAPVLCTPGRVMRLCANFNPSPCVRSVRGTTRSTKNAKKVASLKAICPGAKHELELVRAPSHRRCLLGPAFDLCRHTRRWSLICSTPRHGTQP